MSPVLGCVVKWLMLGCKWHSSALPVLTYFNVRCAPVLEKHHFRFSLSHFTTHPGVTRAMAQKALGINDSLI
jgi:hypothetical protein